MEEQELRCPWCGGPLEKGQMWGDSYGFVTEGVKMTVHNPFKRVTEKENAIWFRNYMDNPSAYACRSCRKIILPY